MTDCYSHVSDTIAAISTPRGKAAIAIIRLSGAEAHKIVKYVTSPSCTKFGDVDTSSVTDDLEMQLCDKKCAESKLKFNKMQKTTFYYNSEKLDEGMFCLYKAPKSYTGEDMAELYCHGNDFIVSQVLECLLQHCRLARKGEFTHRAFLNRKIDLTQAEAIGNLLNAESQKAQKSALLQLEGRLYNKIRDLLDSLTELRILFELAIDFVEDEVPDYKPEIVVEKINNLLYELSSLIDVGQNGIFVQNGFKICLTGAPNVGKSSMFNAFLQTERAIISHTPGTTRDYLEDTFYLNGFLIRLYDTAGIHESLDPVEKIGIRRSKQLLKEVDCVIYITDPSIDESINQCQINWLPENKLIRVLNKIDLITQPLDFQKWKGYIPCSTITKDGLSELKQILLSKFDKIDSEMETGIISTARQLSCVKNAYKYLAKAKESFQKGTGIDFIAFDIQQASNFLEQIIGKVSEDDVLTKIFENFCIGK